MISYLITLFPLGACEALVSAIRNHKTQPVVVERACHATAALAKLHGNAGWFGASGCLEALLVSQNVHVDNHFVQGAAWLALANLCIDENNRVKLVSSGACERVVEALERHIEDRTLVHSAALAVERLSELKDEPFRGVMRLETINTGDSVANEVSDKRSSSKMLAEDAVLTEDSQVTEGLKVTPRSQMYPERALLDDNHQADNVEDLEEEEFASDSGVLSQCNSDSKLSSLVPATVETSYEEISLDNTDAVVNKSPVVPALSVEIMTDTVIEESSKLEYNDNDGGEEVSSVMFMSPRTVVSQSTVCPNDTEVFVYMRSPDTAKGKFFTARCHDSLVHALDRHCTDEKTASQLCRTIARLCQGHGGAKQPERVAFGRAGGPTELVRVLQEHPNSELVTRWACNALSEAIRENKRNKMAVRNQGACELLVQALRKHRHSASGHITVESACIAIYHLCLHNSSTKQIFGKAGAVEGLLETMELHQRTLESVYACCIALYQVCLGNMSNINSLNVSGAAAILSGVLQKHIDVKNLATAAVSTLVLMSCSKNLAGQQNLSLAGIYKQIPSLFLRYEKLDSLSTSLCATITLLTYRNAKNKTHLGQTGLLKGVFQITEKLIGIIWDDLQSKSRKKLPSPTLTLQSVVARSEAALSGRSDSSAIVADSETGENTSSVPQLDLFSPSFIHPSITGIVLHKSEYDHTERMQTNAAAVLLEESLRALGNLIIDHDVNKGKILAAHPNILEILRPVAFYNSGMLSMTNDDGASTERQHLAIIRIAKLVHIIFLQLTIHM